jgi:hypothetical protein
MRGSDVFFFNPAFSVKLINCSFQHRGVVEVSLQPTYTTTTVVKTFLLL